MTPVARVLFGLSTAAVVHGEVGGLAVEVSLELDRIDRPLEVRDLQLVDVPGDVRVLAHVEIAHERGEADARDVEPLHAQRKPFRERLHLDVAELGDALGDLHARVRARHHAAPDAEVTLHRTREAEPLDADPFGLEVPEADVGDRCLRRVAELGVERDPTVDVGRAGHAVDDAKRRAHADVTVECRVVALRLREADREVTERELHVALVVPGDVAVETRSPRRGRDRRRRRSRAAARGSAWARYARARRCGRARPRRRSTRRRAGPRRA